MLIGIMGDSHDKLSAISKAVDFFNGKGTDLVIHTGDYISPFVERKFSRLDCELKGVLGNNDGEKDGLTESIGINDNYLDLEFKESDGKLKMFVLHGVNNSIVQSLALSGEYDFVVRGHTHQPSIDKKKNGSFIINPGETSGYLNYTKSVGILDTENKTISIFDLDTEEVILKEDYR